jgi:hypothetical protein
MNYDAWYYDLMVFSAEWRFNIGSFCLVRHQGINGIPPEECVRDRYWKARIVEIRGPERKSITSPVSIVVKCLV